MIAPFRYRVLIVDDEPEFSAVMKLYARELEDIATVTFVSSRTEALAAVEKHVHHFVSIDQRIPDRPGEAPLDDNGLELCAELVQRAPLMRRVIYTRNPRTRFAQEAGSLDGTEYFEKFDEHQSKEAIPLDKYFSTVVRSRLESYIHWALSRSRNVLPPAFGGACATLGEKLAESFWDDGTSAVIEDRINWLWEQTLWLSWAHACCLARAAQLDDLLRRITPEARTEYAINSLMSLWDSLARAGWLRSWRKYITPPPSGGRVTPAGGAFGDAADVMRRFRNDGAHFSRMATTKSDIRVLEPAILVWVDALAFWADHPFMSGPRLHPSDRQRLQFVKLAGPVPWRVGAAVTDADLPPEEARRGHVFALHRGPSRDVLVDLFPLVSLVDRAGRPPELSLMIPKGRTVKRISLLDGGETNPRMSDDERDALRALFGGRWRPE